MKKLIFVLVAILAFSFCTAFAEESSEDIKIILWEHIAKLEDAEGNMVDTPVKVTLTYKEPLEISEIDVDVSDGYIAQMTRPGVAPVIVAISPADLGPHANLNDATEEELQLYIAAVAQQYEEGKYTSEITKSAYGNVYLAVGDEVTRSVWMVYEDTIIEIIQFNTDFTELTDEDQAFAVEILQGIWME